MASSQYFLETTILALYQTLSFSAYTAFVFGILSLSLSARYKELTFGRGVTTVVFWFFILFLYLFSRSVLVLIQATAGAA